MSCILSKHYLFSIFSDSILRSLENFFVKKTFNFGEEIDIDYEMAYITDGEVRCEKSVLITGCFIGDQAPFFNCPKKYICNSTHCIIITLSMKSIQSTLSPLSFEVLKDIFYKNGNNERFENLQTGPYEMTKTFGDVFPIYSFETEQLFLFEVVLGSFQVLIGEKVFVHIHADCPKSKLENVAFQFPSAVMKCISKVGKLTFDVKSLTLSRKPLSEEEKCCRILKQIAAFSEFSFDFLLPFVNKNKILKFPQNVKPIIEENYNSKSIFIVLRGNISYVWNCDSGSLQFSDVYDMEFLKNSVCKTRSQCEILLISESSLEELQSRSDNEIVQRWKLMINARKSRAYYKEKDYSSAYSEAEDDLSWLEIVNNYICLKDRMNCRLTCRKWDGILRYKLNIHSLDFKMVSDKNNDFSLERYSFFVKGSNQFITELKLTDLGERFNVSHARFMIKYCPKIRTIDFSKSSCVSSKVVHILAENLVDVEEINFPPLASRHKISVLSNNKWEKLRKIRVVLWKMSENFTKSLLLTNPNVRTLVLIKCPNFSDESLSIITRYCKSIEELTITGSLISDASLKWISTDLNLLVYLDVSLSFLLTDIGFLELSRGFQELKHLDISNCMSITERSVIYVCETFKTLSFLSIRNCKLCKNIKEYVQNTLNELKELRI